MDNQSKWKNMIERINRVAYIIKIKWRFRKYPKFIREISYKACLDYYDYTIRLKKAIRQSTIPKAEGIYLDNMGALHGIPRPEGMNDISYRELMINHILERNKMD